jgi:hypothetical protein
MDISRSKSDWQQIAEISNCTPRRLPIRFALSLRTFHSNRSQEWSESQYKMSRSSERMPSQFEFVPAISRVYGIVLTKEISVFAPFGDSSVHSRFSHAHRGMPSGSNSPSQRNAVPALLRHCRGLALSPSDPMRSGRHRHPLQT